MKDTDCDTCFKAFNVLCEELDLVGVVVIEETRDRVLQRYRREVKRVGRLRFLDVVAFRAYYKLALSAADTAWEEQRQRELVARYPEAPQTVPIHFTPSPNAPATAEFIRACAPDLVLARCKTLLKPEVFSIPPNGTFVMHPGACPEYRNAHGAFWALANGERDKAVMSLLRIDRGVDTGPVFGFFGYDIDEKRESHIVIQNRIVFDNLDAIARVLQEIHAGTAQPIDACGRKSAAWGQPWLTSYLKWKLRAARRAR